jgi:hypothetical protein
MLEQLKQLSTKEEGLVIEFPTKAAGSAATKRLATMALEDGWLIFQQLTGNGGARYVWAQKSEDEA